MDGYEPSRLDLGDVRSQRGGKERQKAPEDTVLNGLVLFLFMLLCSIAGVLILQWRSLYSKIGCNLCLLYKYV